MKSNTRTKFRQPISFVICAAGKGERFTRHGLKTPKPLLKLNGITMLERSLTSLNIEAADQVIIIAHKDHALKVDPRYELLEIDYLTRGQLDTFMLARNRIVNQEVVIYNCDTYFESNELSELLSSQIYDGIIPCSIQKGTSWSFCKVDENNNVIKVAEKDPISEWASVGYYYFKDKDLLFNLSEQELNEVKDKELYVAPVYERYLSLGKKIKMAATDSFLPFGTIEQVHDYWGISLEELSAQNS